MLARKRLIVVAEIMRRRLVFAAVGWQAPVIAYCFDLHPKMHPNSILGDFGQSSRLY
jgi:hypothetical protein